MSYLADQLMKIFERASSPINIFRSDQKLARAMAPHMPGMAGADIAATKGYMGDVFKANAHLRGVLAGERGATQRQKIAGDYGVQLQNMRNLSDQVVQTLRNKGLINLEQERGYNEESMLRLGDRLSSNRSPSVAYPGSTRSYDDLDNIIEGYMEQYNRNQTESALPYVEDPAAAALEREKRKTTNPFSSENYDLYW